MCKRRTKTEPSLTVGLGPHQQTTSWVLAAAG
jgi:hypothetical protein